jgi:hypothetical protein
MKKLPIGVQTFEKLRTRNCVYVDKTEQVYQMITEGNTYFLSRPRRFGKSLLVSTLEAVFRGQKDLFEGLYIHDKWDWSQQFPVIRIDWTQISFSTLEGMEISMISYLNIIAHDYQITLTSQSASDCFRDLIIALRKKTGNNVVILIDEYDIPVTDHLFALNFKEIKNAVHNFYRVMKGSDKYIHFIFITGVSKFSGLSVFSALNNPDDITLDKKYASICGYTQTELDNNFMEYIDAAADSFDWSREKVIERIRFFYNGYSWDGKTSVYNPFSTLHFLKDQSLDTYWYNTGTPTFLIEMLRRYRRTNLMLEETTVERRTLSNGYTPENPEETPLLFQTGYLTVKNISINNHGKPYYTLGVPNYEVNDAFLTQLLLVYRQ